MMVHLAEKHLRFVCRYARRYLWACESEYRGHIPKGVNLFSRFGNKITAHIVRLKETASSERDRRAYHYAMTRWGNALKGKSLRMDAKLEYRSYEIIKEMVIHERKRAQRLCSLFANAASRGVEPRSRIRTLFRSIETYCQILDTLLSDINRFITEYLEAQEKLPNERPHEDKCSDSH